MTAPAIRHVIVHHFGAHTGEILNKQPFRLLRPRPPQKAGALAARAASEGAPIATHVMVRITIDRLVNKFNDNLARLIENTPLIDVLTER